MEYICTQLTVQRATKPADLYHREWLLHHEEFAQLDEAEALEEVFCCCRWVLCREEFAQPDEAGALEEVLCCCRWVP